MILVFKTNIRDNQSVGKAGDILNAHSDISRWNFDHWDIDNILRIETDTDCSDTVIERLSEAGFYCATLED
ncbi:MAG: hypothetical protein JNM67_07025 [Bacteroidetes bacterium]|nr:hypothetical protein [Bacteroidota bacterium]